MSTTGNRIAVADRITAAPRMPSAARITAAPRRPAGPACVNVSIDRLLLRGVAPADRPHLIAAVRAELQRLLSNPETRSAWARAPHLKVLRLGNLPFTSGASGSRHLGHAIAAGISGGIAAAASGRASR
jgi:hypothetical protein